MEAHGHRLHIPATFLLTKSIEISRKQNHKVVQRFSQGSQHFNIFKILSVMKFHSKHLSFSLYRSREGSKSQETSDPTFKALLKKNSLVSPSGNNLKDVQLLQLLLTVKSSLAPWGGGSCLYPNLLALVVGQYNLLHLLSAALPHSCCLLSSTQESSGRDTASQYTNIQI